MNDMMNQKRYDLPEITGLLLKMRENCILKQDTVYDDPERMKKYDALNAAIDMINNPSLLVTGDTSDGYHTFNELYHHRAVLFSVIVMAFPDQAWKSKKHSDGSMYDGMFIVGINTPYGQATYHYDVDPYWDMFKCKELECAPEWDGHTAADAIERIGKLEPVRYGKWIDDGPNWICSWCGTEFKDEIEFIEGADNYYMPHYCPHCGAEMDLQEEIL